MNNEYNSTVISPDVWESDNWRLSAFYNPNKNSNSFGREIDEINFTYDNSNSNNQKFIDLVITNNVFEITESFNPRFQDWNNNDLPESQLKLSFQNGELTFSYYYKNEEGHIKNINASAIADGSEDCQYLEYEVDNKEQLINCKLPNNIVNNNLSFIDVIFKIRSVLLSDEVGIAMNDIIYNIKQLSNQGINDVYDELGLLAHYKNKLDQFELQSENKHVR